MVNIVIAPLSRAHALKMAFMGYVPTLTVGFLVLALVLILRLFGTEVWQTLATGAWLLLSLKCTQWVLNVRTRYLSRSTRPASEEFGARWVALLIYAGASLATISLGLVVLNLLTILHFWPR